MAAAGATSSEIRAVRQGWIRLRAGVYVPEGLDPLAAYRARCAAVLDALAPSAMLTGPAAAAVLELPIPGPPPKSVTVRGIPRGEYASDILVINGGADSFQAKGLRLAHPAVIAADCARHLCARDALIAADALTHEGWCTVEELMENARRSSRTRGAARVRWQSQFTGPRSESPGETWTRIVLAQLGYVSSSQVVVVDGDFSARLDFLLADGRTVVEFDGAIKYRGPDGQAAVTVMNEKERQGFLEAMGHRFVRIIWKQLSNPPVIDRRIRFAGVVPSRKPLQLPHGWPVRFQ